MLDISVLEKNRKTTTHFWLPAAKTHGFEEPKQTIAPHIHQLKPLPHAQAGTAGTIEPLAPYSYLVEIPCQDCGGKGYDVGSVNAREPEDCPACLGSGKELVLRNYLAEVFRFAADPETDLQLQRAHVVALITYARQTVSALMMNLPGVA